MYAVETYLFLSDEEKQVYQRLIREVYPEVNEMITNPLIEQGLQQGLQQGRHEGLQQGLQESIFKIVAHRFPHVSAELRPRIWALNETPKLERLLEAALAVDSPEQLMANGFFES